MIITFNNISAKLWLPDLNGWLRVMVFSATFNNISVTVYCGSQFYWWGNQSTWRKPLTCCKSLTHFITYCYIEYTSPLARLEHTTLVVIGTDCISCCKSNYHTNTTTRAHRLNGGKPYSKLIDETQQLVSLNPST